MCINKTFWIIFCTSLSILFLLSVPAAQNCNERGTLKNDTDLWSCAPQYVTGRGWVFGNRVGNLPKGTQVFICQKRTIGFGFSKQKWFQIAYYWNKQWNYAWIFSGHIQTISKNQDITLFTRYFLPKEAIAQTASSSPNSNFDAKKLSSSKKRIATLPIIQSS
jgi:hypothetical protein